MKSKNKAGNEISNQIAKNILEEIKVGRYKNVSRLPSEIEIASYMGASRSAVRDAFAILEMEGYIGRKRGLGTIVNRHVLAVRTRIDLEEEFLEMIKEAGYTPKIESVTIESIVAGDEIANKLLLREKEEIYKISKTVSADGIPLIYCRDYFTKRLIKDENYDESELEVPIFEFLDKRCNERVNMDLSEIHAIGADKDVAEALDLKMGTPVLHLKETGHNFDGLPILYSEEYYKEGMLNHTILRKNIGF